MPRPPRTKLAAHTVGSPPRRAGKRPVRSTRLSERAYLKLMVAGRKVPPSQVIRFSGDAERIHRDVQRGVRAVVGHSEKIERGLPGVDLASIRALPLLALALRRAANEAETKHVSQGSALSLLERARRSRALLLPAAETLAKAGLAPTRDVQKIQEAQGAEGLAASCIELASFFKKHGPRAHGKLPITPESIDEAAAVGKLLMGLLRPGLPRTAIQRSLGDAQGIRDRLWTLLLEAHAELRRVGHWLFGDELDQHVPSLQPDTEPDGELRI